MIVQQVLAGRRGKGIKTESVESEFDGIQYSYTNFTRFRYGLQAFLTVFSFKKKPANYTKFMLLVEDTPHRIKAIPLKSVPARLSAKFPLTITVYKYPFNLKI